VDVARTAVRLGAKTVKMVCLEDEEEMPAWDWERQEALEESIEIIHRRGPTGVVAENGRMTGLVVREVERVFDEDGRFAPTYFDERLSTIDAQMVIIAIGQRSNLSLAQGSAIELDQRGRLVFDRRTMATSAEGVFACGEVVTGAGSAIEAVASGHRAAQAVLSYLETGRAQLAEEQEAEKVADLPQEVIEKVKRIQRVAMPTLSPEERKKSFVQFELGYSEKEALREAARCLACTAGAVVDEAKCAACLACLRVCPFDVPVVTDVAAMGSEMCQACGLCAAECPALAISIRRFAERDIKSRIVQLIQSSEKAVTRVDIVCAQDAETREALRDRVVTVNGEVIAKVPVTCAARADEVDMMKGFEFGAQTVLVQRCSECRYPGADDRLLKRVQRTKELLDAAGVGADKLTLV
ncbi:MAG: FAD-dependent oxidoreductase, partial [Candidatus Brocadiae bacterium]|nr:FAD-dependent oxidoreductase [Candidatus Brocadiia bacterium]